MNTYIIMPIAKASFKWSEPMERAEVLLWQLIICLALQEVTNLNLSFPCTMMIRNHSSPCRIVPIPHIKILGANSRRWRFVFGFNILWRLVYWFLALWNTTMLGYGFHSQVSGFKYECCSDPSRSMFRRGYHDILRWFPLSATLTSASDLTWLDDKPTLPRCNFQNLRQPLLVNLKSSQGWLVIQQPDQLWQSIACDSTKGLWGFPISGGWPPLQTGLHSPC